MRFRLLCAVLLSVALECLASAAVAQTWMRMDSGTESDLNGVWGGRSSDVFAVGEAGTILHYNGISWRPMASGTSADFTHVFGVTGQAVLAAALLPPDAGGHRASVVYEYDGSNWSELGTQPRAAVSPDAAPRVTAVHGPPGGPVHIATRLPGGASHIFRYTGAWEEACFSVSQQVESLWIASESDLFAAYNGRVVTPDANVPCAGEDPRWGDRWAGPFGFLPGGFNQADFVRDVWAVDAESVHALSRLGVYRFNAVSGQWEERLSTSAGEAIWGYDDDDLFLLGSFSSPHIQHWDGESWSLMDVPDGGGLRDIWGPSLSDAFAVGQEGTILHLDRGLGSDVAIEGGVRYRLDLDWDASASPRVVVDEIELEASLVAVSGDRTSVYFTPPPHEVGLVDVRVENPSGRTQTFEGFLEYTDDVMRGFNATRRGLTTYYEEVLHDRLLVLADRWPQEVVRVGAISEVLLYGLLRRAASSAPTGSAARDELTAAFESFLPTLRELINQNRSPDLLFRAVVRPPTYGQTVHFPFRYVPAEIALLTLATGTLVLTPGPAPGAEELEDTVLTEGLLVLPGESLPPSFAGGNFRYEGWTVQLALDAEQGIRIAPASVWSPEREFNEHVVTELGFPSLEVGDGAGNFQSFGFDESNLSHIYINHSVSAYVPTVEGSDEIEEGLIAAVYRINLDGSEHSGNTPRAALVARQSVAFSAPMLDFEPTKCLMTAHVFPRLSFSVSTVEPGDSAASVRALRANQCLSLDPQRIGPGEAYRVGLFRDLDRIQWWLTDRQCLFPECVPAPFWRNIFDLESTWAPLLSPTFFTTPPATIDNVHLQHYHPRYLAWVESSFEAPGSFNGTVHLHWRWGAGYGPRFGDGAVFFPASQRWWVATIPRTMAGVCEETNLWSLIELGAQRSDSSLLDVETTLVIGSEELDVVPSRQYESFSTGFSYALGSASVFEGICCPIAELASDWGGYVLFSKDIPQLLLNFMRGLGRFGPAPVCDDPPDRAGATFLSSDDPRTACIATATPPEPTAQPRCHDIRFEESMVGQRTPLAIELGNLSVDLAAIPRSDGLMVAENLTVTALGYLLGEPAGEPGSRLSIRFSPPVLLVRQLPFALNATNGTATVSAEVYRGEALLSTIAATAAVPEGGQVAEGALEIDLGLAFDRVELVATSPDQELAINHFVACTDLVLTGDLDFDGLVDERDFQVLARCFGNGPDVPMGYGCTDADLDGDRDVDCDDVGRFASVSTFVCDADEDGFADFCADEVALALALAEPGSGSGDGCACTIVGPSARQRDASLLALVLILLALRRRRRPNFTHEH